ncbi:hypothetical protein BA6E_105118 [Bacteroidales bacterium 6E]|nr:hypothetical protein BA6E_105118 [Bacteroidales bacterium 6E]
MGKIYKGILGGFSGKVGTVVGFIRNGVAYMRSIAAAVAQPNTLPQLEQRAKFGLAISFIRPLTEFLKIGFRNYTGKMSAVNYAMSQTLKNGIRGTYPDFSIDYANVLVSKGTLAGVLNPIAVSLVAGEVSISWDDNSDEVNAQPTDSTLILAINPTTHEAVFTNGESTRVEGTQTLAVPTSFSGETLECYMAFADADGKVATSKYVGPVVIA